MGTTLILIGIGCMIAGIVGGGVKLSQLHVGTIKSVWRQTLLFLFGGVVTAAGAGMNADWPKGDQVGNVQGSVGPGPVENGAAAVENGTAPEANRSVPFPSDSTEAAESDGAAADPDVNIAGRWSVEGTVIVFRQAGTQLLVTGPGISGTGTLIGSEARWQIIGEDIGTVGCRGEVMEDQKVIAGACVDQAGETLPIRLDRL